MADEVDKLFEDLFGYSDTPAKKQAPATPPDKGLLELADEVEKPTGTVEDAARAVAEALEAHLATPKTRKAVQFKFWRPVIAKTLGFNRVVTKRLMEVIDKGVELHLFAIDESGVFPFIVPCVHEDPSDPEEEDEEDEGDEEGPPPRQDLPTRPPPPPSGPPEDWDPPGHLDCGHWDWQSVPREAKEGDDPMKRAAAVVTRIKSPEDCPACKKGVPGHPQYQKGKYRTPVTENMRRTPERDAGPGFPGYCVDEDGFYIGGIANHCRYSNPDGPWCVVHAPRGSKRKGKA